MYHLRGRFSHELVVKISSVIEKMGCVGVVAVCRDTRPSSACLHHHISSMLLKNGNEVRNLGVGPTPYLSRYTKINSCLGIMITASHNPEEDNGIKLFHSGLEASIPDRPIKSRMPSQNEYDCRDFRYVYIKDAVRGLDSEAVKRRSPKIVVDFGNASSSAFTAHALRMLGAKAITINADHSVPFSRPSEPDKNIPYLAEFVERVSADFAVAHDADSDRCRIVTREGIMNQDVQLLNMADYMCSKGDVFVTTVEASQLVADELRKKGVSVLITPVGSNYVGEKVKSAGASFGGEPCGEYIFPDWLFSADGVYAALKFAEMHCKRGFKSYKPYHTIRDAVMLKGNSKADVMERILKKVDSLGITDINTMDGLLFNHKGVKVLVRASNTQDIIRITTEHPDENAVKNIHSEINELVRSCLKV